MPWSLIIGAAAGAVAGLVGALIRDEGARQMRAVVIVLLFLGLNYPAQKYIAKPLIADQELGKVSAFAAIKTHEPATYNVMRNDLISAMQGGADLKAVKARIHASVGVMAKKYMPRCSDKALVRYIRVTTDEIEEISKKDAKAGFDFLFPKPGAYLDVQPLLSDATSKEDLAALADVIATGAGAKPQEVDTARANELLSTIVSDIGLERVKLLADPNAPGVDKAEIVATTAELYRRVLELPEADAALVLRVMFATADAAG
jgi:hypothetical protein